MYLRTKKVFQEVFLSSFATASIFEYWHARFISFFEVVYTRFLISISCLNKRILVVIHVKDVVGLLKIVCWLVSFLT